MDFNTHTHTHRASGLHGEEQNASGTDSDTCTTAYVCVCRCELYLSCLVLSIAFRRCGRFSVVYVASGGFGTNMAVGRVGLAARTGRCKRHYNLPFRSGYL